MLVLTRKQAETIQVGDRITIKVIATGRGKVKLGIDAPSDIRVLRGELDPLTRPAAEQDEDSESRLAVRMNHPVA